MSLQVTYIGHATTLIQWDGVTILTDPVFSSRVLFFKRAQPLAYDLSQLPKLDAILLSHAHYDHLDLFSYKYIPREVPIVIPEGMSKAISPFVNNPVIELATWGRYKLEKDLEICAVPARHPGGRLFFPYRYPKCHGYILTKNKENIYFAGDTAYRNDFKDLAALYKLKLALLPFATTQNNGLMRRRHMNVDEVIQCWMDLGQPDCIPIHWGTFFTYLSNPERLLHQVKKKMAAYPPLEKKLHILKANETFELS